MNNSGKANGCLIAVIVFLAFIILLMAAVFFIFFLGRSDMPDVDEFIAEVESSERTTDNNSSITDIINIRADEGGVSEITITLTNADLTALANDVVDSNPDIPIESLLFNCNADETIDITGVVTDLTVYADSPDIPGFVKALLGTANGKRLYATVYINHISGNEFDIDIVDVRIEKLNIPMVESIFEPMSNDIAQMLMDQLDAQENFVLKEFTINENELSLRGTVTE
ncbi:MAG: hypothetical protein R3232_01925 [Clostridia bacterium]|nr:hypothetical protein [Clostridia bacterium]